MSISFFLSEIVHNPTSTFLFLELYFLVLIFGVLGALFGESAEKRILAFFIYFELTHLLCVLLLLSWSLTFGVALTEVMTASLFIIGSSGAETGIALALFMRYFRLTGRTIFFSNKEVRQPWLSMSLLRTEKI